MRKILLSIPVGLLILSLACGQLTPTTTTPSRSATPKVPLFLSSTPKVQSLCLQANAGEFSDEIIQATESILAELGLTTVPAGAKCDATLTFDVTIVPLSLYYHGLTGPGATCYTGAKATGEVKYAVGNAAPKRVPIERQFGPATGVILYSCPGPEDAPYTAVWSDVVFYSLYMIWGNEVVFVAAGDDDESIRSRAMGWLQTIYQEGGPDAEKALSVLLQTLDLDPAPSVRVSAANVLGYSTWHPDPRIIQALAHALTTDEDPKVRAQAAQTIGHFREEAIEALPALIQALNDSDSWVRHNAATAIGDIGPAAVEAVPALIEILDDEAQAVRVAATHALGEIGLGAKEAIPALIQALEDKDVNVQRSAARALKDITGQDFGEDPAAWKEWWSTQK